MEPVELTPDREAARRIAFTIAKVACRFKLPLQSSPEMLIQCAMEQPEAVTPEEFKLIYLMRSREAVPCQ